MEEAFEKLREQGKNDVENLVQWMKDSKIIDNTKETTDKAFRLFEDSLNKQSIELAKFKEVLEKLATQQQKSVEEFAKSLADESDRMLNKLRAGAEAFVEAFNK